MNRMFKSDKPRKENNDHKEDLNIQILQGEALLSEVLSKVMELLGCPGPQEARAAITNWLNPAIKEKREQLKKKTELLHDKALTDGRIEIIKEVEKIRDRAAIITRIMENLTSSVIQLEDGIDLLKKELIAAEELDEELEADETTLLLG